MSVDDFGIGYTGLSQLRTLAVSEIKIDRTLRRRTCWATSRTGPSSRSVIELGHRLGCAVTAEGVETQDVADWLAAAGCDHAQGYLWLRPAPWTDVDDARRSATPSGVPGGAHGADTGMTPASAPDGGAAPDSPLAPPSALGRRLRRDAGRRRSADGRRRRAQAAASTRPCTTGCPRRSRSAARCGSGPTRRTRPMSSFGPDGRTIVGFEPDLGAALGRVLGVRFEFVNTDFTELLPDVVDGRHRPRACRR